MDITQLTLWPPSFRGAIFDFDGTLVDSVSIWRRLDEEFLARRGLRLEADHSEHLSTIGFDEAAFFMIEKYELEETPQEIYDEWNEMAIRLYATEVELRPGAYEYISDLRRMGVPCSVATANARSVLEATIEHLQLDELFDAFTFVSEVTRSKSSPDVYELAARRIGRPAEQCVVFEDLDLGIRAASSAGMWTVGMITGDRSQDIASVVASADISLSSFSGLSRQSISDSIN